MAVFTGNANPMLAQDIVRHLMQPLGRAIVGRFSDGEIQVEIMENVRGKDVYLVQSTCPPANEHLMELLVMADACRRASAGRITAVIPYLGYARQDRRQRAMRVPITAKLVADMIGRAGVNRVLTVDLHADQIQGFFDVPVDNVYASPVLLGEVWKQKYENMIVVSPDVGGVVRARALARRLDNADLAIIDKRAGARQRVAGDEHHRRRARQVLRDGGRPRGYRGHAVPGGAGAEGRGRGARDRPTSRTRCCRATAVERIANSALDELVVTDTIPLARGREGLQAHPRDDGRGAAGRDDAADSRRGVRQLAVRGLGGADPSEGSRRMVRRRLQRDAGAWSRAGVPLNRE